MSLKYIQVSLYDGCGPILTYVVPPEFTPPLEPIDLVLVPLRGRRRVGCVETSLDQPPPGSETWELKPVAAVFRVRHVLGAELIEEVRWLAEYYLTSYGTALRTILPPGLRILPAVRYRRGAAARDEGLAVEGVTGSMLAAVLEACTREEQGVGADEFLGLLGRGRVARSRREVLLARGIVTAFETLDLESSESPVLGYRYGKEPSTGRLRSPLGWRILEQVREKSYCSRDELLRVFPAAASTVRRLVDLGALVPQETRRELPVAAYHGRVVVPGGEKPPVLHSQQVRVVEECLTALQQGGFSAFLLQGVTGSGKTEVYLRLIAEVLAAGRQALVLVPEIALTPQMVEAFHRRFGESIAVVHSRLGEAERAVQWRRIREGTVDIAIGARSVVFSPFARLGIIVVDEEHDRSYKQENGVRYQARDLALVKARRLGIPVVLGSATPSLESRHNAELGKYRRLLMPERVEGATLPRIDVVDLRTQPLQDRELLLSRVLHQEIERNLERGEKTLLFLNRRGFASCTLCLACGARRTCPNCSITLRLHQGQGLLRCHYCEYSEAVETRCRDCGRDTLGTFGLGTEKLEQGLRRLYPGAVVVRLDADSMAGKDAHLELDRLVRAPETAIVVGTQLISKGLDVPEITLVGVILADLDLHFPDFRAAERVFQLVTQVAGRAGRREREGRVIVQSFTPEHFALSCAFEHDVETFYTREVAVREACGFPPLFRLHALRLAGKEQLATQAFAVELGLFARQRLRESGLEARIRVLGPSVAPLERLKGWYRHQLLLVSERAGDLQWLSRCLLAQLEGEAHHRGLRLSVDVDPYSFQ